MSSAPRHHPGPSLGRSSSSSNLVLSSIDLDQLTEHIADRVVETLAAQAAVPRLLTREQLAQQWGVSPPMISRMRGEGMPSLMIGDAVRFDPDACLTFLRDSRGER